MPFTILKDFGEQPRQRIAFDCFEVDVRSGELRKNGHRVRLQAQPFQLLVLLLENSGEVVTREEICRRLWPGDTFVDFEHSLPAAVNKIREALGDAASDPQYVETLPKRGYRFIGKINAELPVVMTPAEPQAGPGLVAIEPRKVRSFWKPALAAAAAVILVAATAMALLHGKMGSSAATVYPALTAVPFTALPGLQTAPAISPDGSRIAFAWDPGKDDASEHFSGGTPGKRQYDLYVKAVGSETLLRLTNHPSDWISPAWSPDGTQIAFHRLAGDETGIYVVPALGGPERKLAATHAPYEVAAIIGWSPDGKWLAYSDAENDGPLNRAYLLNVATLESHPLPHDPACRHEGALGFSHSGKELLLVCVRNTTNFGYVVSDVDGKNRREFATRTEFPSSAIWTPDDAYVIVAAEGEQHGEFYQIRVSDGLTRKLSSIGGDWPTLSSDGRRLAYSFPEFQLRIWRQDLVNPKAPAVEMYPSSRRQNNAQYSPDGKRVAFDSARSGTWSVWLGDSDGQNIVQVSQGALAGYPEWSPDSRTIAFIVSEADGRVATYLANVADRVPHKLKTNIASVNSPHWSHDGKWIYFLGYQNNGHQLYRCPVEGGDATLLVGSLEVTEPMESFDGKILYFPERFGNADMLMMALDHPGAAPQRVPNMPKIFDQNQIRVTKDGIFFSPQSRPRSVDFYDFRTQQTRELFQAQKDLADGMSVSPDGRYLLYSETEQSNASVMLVNDFRW